ncbi:S8 family serine peptidase [Actinomadura sp. ATCC 31491]|uniref:S8 family serine peptidase n=1 Tax=Actinomadura luzonensis TaxID=2805427 RepID=A0ABT0FSB7_9ACTN|nr:S8 family serine peptidase [Actinomadura luzonensis]MCK2215237.1 S8 family serine peptidase [Actinomadura luzonensis]
MMRRTVRRLIAAAALAAGLLAAPRTAWAQPPRIDPGLAEKLSAGGEVRVNVLTRDPAGLAAAASAVTSGQVVQRLSRVPVLTLRAGRAEVERLAAQPGVLRVTEDVPVPPSLAESVPLIGADRTREAGLTGEGTVVAVLDSGVASGHPFLGGRVMAEACFSPSDPAYGASSLCPNGADQQEGPGAADADSGPCAYLDCSHGTHVAGIVAGEETGDAAGGVAPGAGLAAVQVYSRFDSFSYCGSAGPPCLLSFVSAQLAGLDKVLELIDQGVPVAAVNLSLGGGRYTAACDDDPRKAAIDRLLAAGAPTVVAAGNNGYADAVSAPACVSSAIAVGSTTDQDEVSSFSNRGPLLDLFAPGSDIVSSVPGGGWQSKSGTSMAAPHVAGALAVLRQARPSATPAELESALKDTGRPIAGGAAVTPRIQLDEAALGAAAGPGPHQLFPARARVLANVQISANSTMTVPVAGVAGLPAGGIAAVALNVAAKGDFFNTGSLAVYPSGEPEPPGDVLFYDATRYASNLVWAKTGDDGAIKLDNRSDRPVRVYLDVHGYTLDHAAATAGGTYRPVPPARVADRVSVPALGNLELSTPGLPDPQAVALTVLVKSASTGTVRVYPAGDAFPADVNADYPAGTPVQFAALVKPGANGKINLYNLGAGAIEVSAEVTGYYTTAERASLVRAIDPVTVADRVPIAAGGTYALRPSGIPTAGVSAVGLVVRAGGAANGTVEVVPPDGVNVRAVAYAAGRDTAGSVTAALRPDGTVVLRNTGASPVTISADAYASFGAR